MKVTQELLKRYSEGICSEEERKIVENWLSSEFDDAKLSDEEFGQSPARIHAKLLSGLNPPQVSRLAISLQRLMYYAAAACVVIGFAVGTAAVVLKKSVVFTASNVNGTTGKWFEKEGFKMVLSPNTEMRLTANAFSENTNLSFCGALKLKNESGDDVNLNVLYQCAESALPQRKTVCRKDKTYYLLTMNLSGNQVLLVRDNRMDTNPLVRANMRKTFSL